MGNSSSHHTAAVAQEMGRGWTQSFPRELTRHHHHSQAPGHKVLPEPPNQRLRATNNGNIIHNGGTISGRRPSAFTLPHDLNKQGIYRSRSTSTSHLGEPRPRNDLGTQHCCAGHYRPCDGTCRENEMIEIKRFGSEPDLRYSPESRHPPMDRHSGYHYPERESRERESRYRGKKKYKAPAPPPINADGSSPDSYKWEVISPERDNCCRQEEEPSSRGIKPPPRKSRLFKTRAETKRQQSSWNPSGQQDCPDNIIESERERERERRWVNDRHQQHQSHQHLSSLSNGKENGRPWREYHEQDDHGQWTRDERRSSKKFDGKNTLQRSLSSPEFQAELMQVAKKVRNKLNYNRRVGPVGAPNELKHENQLSKSTTFIDARKNNLGDKKYSRSKQSQAQENAAVNNDSRVDRRKSRSMEQFDNKCQEVRTCSRFYEERTFQEQRSRGENRVIRSQETRSYEERRMDSPRGVHNSGGSAANGEKSTEHGDERSENNPRRRKVLEKSTTYEESVVTTNESSQRKINGRLEDFHHEDRRKESQFDRRNSNNRATEILVSKITRKSEETGEHMRTRSESPAMLRIGVRGQGSGRESTPEPPRAKENNKVSSGSGSGVAPENPRRKRTDVKDLNYRDCDKRWSESNSAKIEREREREKIKIKNSEKSIVKESKEVVEKTSHWNLSNGVSPKSKQTTTTTTTKTFYTQDKDYTGSSHHQQMSDNQGEDIALKLRPTLPKKQLEIPRFSPSAAWRLLSAQETPGPNMSTASEEIPVMYEERIERLARPPRPLIAMGPRSSHDKSGDSGVSCDAGVPNDDSLDVTVGRLKTQTGNSRPTWTPQQDLGEESSSDAGVDSPPPIAPSAKFPPRAHVFSLSLPRDDNRHCVYTAEKTKDPSFNSLQKIKRSFGLGAGEFDRKHPGETLDDNWLLSTSAPTSLQHSQANQIREVNGGINGSGWDGNYAAEDFEDEALDEVDEKANFPVVMKPPSFSYLASGGHVMYLPASNDTEHRTQSLNYRNSVGEISVKMNNNINNNINITSKNLKSNEPVKICNKNGFINGFTNGISNGFISKLAYDKAKELGLQRERSFTDLGNKNRKYPNFSKSCENISEMKQRSYSPVNGSPESLQDKKIINVNNEMNNNNCTKISIKPSPKSKRFTFQSTVRQIERRRLAEKLSREAEAKERQRKSELEAMRKVEEEFQRKRAKEKANIRQQLRLYSMDENSSSLPPASDSSHLSRADPDGAPSSSASSPTSAPPGKLVNNRKGSVSSDEYHRKKECRVQQQNQKQEPREYKDYRPKYYDWAPNNESSSHLEVKQTTVHPKIVCDIPKSSHVFVDANIHTGKHANLNSTPRSDNYRKDFAHGAVAARSSLASSDSELSQPNTRPHSRQNGNNKNSKPVRTRF